MQSEASKPVKMFRPRDFTRHHKQTKIASIWIYIVIENGAFKIGPKLFVFYCHLQLLSGRKSKPVMLDKDFFLDDYF